MNLVDKLATTWADHARDITGWGPSPPTMEQVLHTLIFEALADFAEDAAVADALDNGDADPLDIVSRWLSEWTTKPPMTIADVMEGP